MAPVNRPNAAEAADPLVGRAHLRRGSFRRASVTSSLLLNVCMQDRELEGHGQPAS